jgi:hypothetical protein
MSVSRVLFLYFVLFLIGKSSLGWAHHPGTVPSAVSTDKERDSVISSGPTVNSPTATTLGKNRFSAGFTFDYFRYDTIPAETAHELHEEGRDIHGKNHEEFYNLYLGYGLLHDLDLYLIAPIVSKAVIQIEDHDHLGRGERSAGFGDMRLLGKLRFWKKFVEIAAIAGVKFPTGETSNKDQSGEKFETEQQPGSGSWDGEFGVTASRSFFERLSLSTSFQYTLKGEGAQERKLGDVFRYNVATSLALRKLGAYPNFHLVLELNHEWALRDHSRTERRVFDSGGTTIFLTPGVVMDFHRHLTAFWGFPLPVYQNLGGEHEELKFEMLAGVSLNF